MNRVENYSSYTEDEKGFFYGIKDKLFKSIIFSDKELTLWFLSKLLGRKVDNFTIRNVEPEVHSASEKEKRMDVVLEIDENLFVDIEANSVYYSKLHMKNFNYLSSLYSQLITSGEKYDNKKELIQFDITRKLPKKYKHDIEEIRYQNVDGCKYLRNLLTKIKSFLIRKSNQ